MTRPVLTELEVPSLDSYGCAPGIPAARLGVASSEVLRSSEELSGEARALESSSRETASAPLSVQDRRRVLVVDDNVINQTVAEALVEALGYDVVVATNGVEALAACHRAPPDMVLMDIEMPLMGGLDATQRLRALQRVGILPPFPIVGATSRSDRYPESVCLNAGMDGCLAKPLDPQRLADELHRILLTRPVRA